MQIMLYWILYSLLILLFIKKNLNSLSNYLYREREKKKRQERGWVGYVLLFNKSSYKISFKQFFYRIKLLKISN